MKWFYDIMYGFFRAPWDIGPREELVSLVESKRIDPCRAIDLGCGTASNCIFLAEQGFDVTGIDYSKEAIKLGKKRAFEANVKVDFLVDDLTNLQQVSGKYDFLVDYGTLDDLNMNDRDLYLKNVIPLTNPGSVFLLFAFEWKARWWEKTIYTKLALLPGEAEERFSKYFNIEKYSEKSDQHGFPPGWVVYLMIRKEEII